MEKYIIIGVVIVLMVLYYFLSNLLIKESKKDIYVHIKTSNKYKFISTCKMKLPVDRSWVNSILYMSLNDGNLYIRESEDFVNNFIKLSDWKNGNKDK